MIKEGFINGLLILCKIPMIEEEAEEKGKAEEPRRLSRIRMLGKRRGLRIREVRG